MTWLKPVLVFGMMLALSTTFSAGPVVPQAYLPADLNGELNGVPYRIVVPGNWNGTLLVYAHGYNEGSTPPALAPQPADVDMLAGQGFALAASRFAGAGWNIKEGMRDTVALTTAFRDLVGLPQRTILWGRSMGGLMALAMIEKFPGIYDAAIALCPPAAGTPRRFDQALDISLAYAAAFGWDTGWGTPGDLRDDLNFMTDVMPHIMMQLTPAKMGYWEFLRRVNRMPPNTFYVGTNRVIPLYFAIAARAELESRAGGPVAENVGRVYTLTGQDLLELAAMGVDGEALLAEMNAGTDIASPRNARNYASHYADPDGRLGRPVLTLHTEGDCLATPNNEGAYRDTVDRQGAGQLLMQQFVPGGGHCTFTPAQELAAVNAMMSWLDSGTRPDPSLFFPAALGFDAGFIPPGWPW